MTTRDHTVSSNSNQDVGAVVIGRNEGERLDRCLRSLARDVRALVYVDSGSTDGSTDLAERLGVHVIRLDATQPFTAARARNSGFRYLTQYERGLAAVQFVDGDCEVEAGWIEAARAHLLAHPRTAVVFGRRRERFPEHSIYNRLFDYEWSIPPGEATSCGGDAMMRFDALCEAGGYRDDLIAGEEPELCVRLRRAGWKIVCIDHPMTLHDAAMTRFSQWWRRTTRTGYGFAEGSHIHGGPPDYHWVIETRRAQIWGLVVPAVIAASVLAFGPWALLMALVYPAQVLRLYLKRRRTEPIPLASSFFHVLGRFPEAVGQIRFFRNRIMGRAGSLIEYKSVADR
ncbi:glycosyltransferase [Hyphomicrobium sp.]|uniref:glycosyltransferase n=1 Tax=Hyphomicrobium sp. TaxID=82 RepID=UPI002FDD1168